MSQPTAPAPLSGAAYLRLVLLGAAIGIPAAVAAALFLALTHESEHWIWHDLPDALGYSSPPWFLILGLPVVGALIVLAARRALPGDGGHEPLAGMSMAPAPLSYAPGVVLAAIGTLGFGVVLGPEAPVVTLGTIVSVAATRSAKLGEKETKVLASAGAFAAISALFGGPLIAGVLLVEGGLALGALLLPTLLPGLVAAAIGYLIFLGFGDFGGLDVPGLAVPDLPPYTGVHAGDLAVAIVVGVVTALIISGVDAAGRRVDGFRPRFGLPALLIGGGFAVGAIALIGDGLGADSQDILFSGQASLPALVATDSTKILLILLVAKALAYAISLGCGFRGGPIFPALFLGVAVASLPIVWFDLSPTLAVAIGAGAGMAAATRLLISPLLLGELLAGTNGTDAISATVLATAAAWLTMAALDRRAAAPTTSE